MSADKIKQFAREIKEARERATQGEWMPCGCRYTMIHTDLNGREILDICEVISTSYTSDEQLESNKQFITLAANNITQLCEMVIEMSEALEAISPKHWENIESRLVNLDALQLIEIVKTDTKIARETLSRITEGLK